MNVLPPHCHRLAAARGVHQSSPRCIADKFRWVFSATTCMHKYSNTSGKGTHVDISYRPTHTHTLTEVWSGWGRPGRLDKCVSELRKDLSLSSSLSLPPSLYVHILSFVYCACACVRPAKRRRRLSQHTSRYTQDRGNRPPPPHFPYQYLCESANHIHRADLPRVF